MDSPCVDHPVVGEFLERGKGDVVAVDLEELAQRPPVVAATEAVGPQHPVAAWHPLADLVCERANVIGRGDDRPLALLEAL